MNRDIVLEATIVEKYAAIVPVLDERARRLWAATESVAIGYGGDALVSSATGLARETIRNGRREIEQGVKVTGRVRRAGAGRPGIKTSQPGIKEALERLVDPVTRGDPRSPLRWTCKSKATLAGALSRKGWTISATTVGRLLHELGYSLQSVSKSREGLSDPDRNAQFEYINATAMDFLKRTQPVISVDTKKKELVGDFKNSGQEWHPKGTPEKPWCMIFPTTPRAKRFHTEYTIWGETKRVSTLGVTMTRLRLQWPLSLVVGCHGKAQLPDAKELFITADAGGSNGYRSRVWKHELQKFSDQTKLRLRVSHFPPGTSKWNKVEHRLFCHITKNWRGKPLRTFETIVDLIGNTRTQAGLRVKAKLDKRKYPTGVVVTKAQMGALSLHRDEFRGEWNYQLHPR